MKTLVTVLFACPTLLGQVPAPAAPATAPASAPFAALQGPLTSPVYDQPADGRLWVAAPGYKASFGADGFTFVPFLGSTAGRNWPVRFTVAEAVVGGLRLPVGERPAARDGETVTLDRGGFREVYRVGTHEIEQMFCFAELPRRGDLTVRLAVDTDLEATANDGGFVFTGANGGVRYGRATAVDAGGRRLTLASRWTGGAITIQVPAEFVATAALPLWIDPVVNAIVNGLSFPAAVTQVDVAGNPNWYQYASVFAYQFSATDSDLYCQRYTDVLATDGSLLTIDSTQDAWSRGRIAYLEEAQEYLVVAEVKTQSVQDWWIGARTVPVSTLYGMSAPIQVARAPVAGQWYAMAPDVGGNGNAGGTNSWAIVWQQGAPGAQRDIRCRTLSALHVLGPSTAIASSTFDEVAPRIARSNGLGPVVGRNWMVVWRSDSATTPILRGCSLDNAGQLRTSFTVAAPVDNEVAYSVSSPAAEALGQRKHLVVFDGHSTATASRDVFGVLLNNAGGVVRPVTDLTLLETALGTGRNRDQSMPAVDCDGIRYMIAYVHEYSATDLDVRAMTVAETASPAALVVHDSATVANTFDGESLPAIAASLDDPARGVIGWRKTLAGGSYRPEYRLYDAMATAGGFAVRATGCGGLPISSFGVPALGAEFTISLPVQGLRGFVAGLPVNLPVPACPGCLQGADGSTVFAPTVSVTVPPSASFVGVTLAFQGFDFAAPACLNAVRLSDTVDVTIR